MELSLTGSHGVKKDVLLHRNLYFDSLTEDCLTAQNFKPLNYKKPLEFLALQQNRNPLHLACDMKISSIILCETDKGKINSPISYLRYTVHIYRNE